LEFFHTGGDLPPEFVEYLVWEHFHRSPEEVGARRILEFLTVHGAVVKAQKGK
jgi:hypothetical protein